MKSDPSSKKWTGGYPPVSTRWTEELAAELVTLRNSGKTLRALGEHYGVSKHRIRMVLDKTERKARWKQRHAQ